MIARTKIKILLFEDNPGDARLINEYLKDNLIVEFSLVHVENLESGLKRLEVSTPGIGFTQKSHKQRTRNSGNRVNRIERF